MPERNDRETGESNRRQLQGLPVIRRNVAGIDLGSERHWVCAPTQDGSGREIASFGATTPELLRLGEWLQARQVESVAMESTGVYWIAPHEVLEGQGLQVLRVDAAAAQLRTAAGFVPAGGSGLHAANPGTG